MTDIIRGSTRKPVSSEQLSEFFESAGNTLDGELYIGYPIIAAPEGAFPIDGVWISPTKGIVIFNLTENRLSETIEDEQDESANRLETKFRSHKALMKGRKLLAAPTVITFAPAAEIPTDIDPDYPVCNSANLHALIDKIEWEHGELYESVLSVIQSISTIRRSKRSRNTNDPESRGSKLKFLEDSIANLDTVQGKAVIETVKGVQRIRGLAGSGKTIILALKAAYLHTQHPDWKIAITFNTRSLKDQFNRLINTFVIEQSGEEPDWSKIQILNAWGAPGGSERSGIYYEYTQVHGLEFLDYRTAKGKFNTHEPFPHVCSEALKQPKSAIPVFDVILIDEAQDFAPEFFRLCFSMLSDEKMLVYAYDELQSLTNSSLPPPTELFGNDENGRPLVKFDSIARNEPQQDIILEKCYRNSRPVLATAHALGFGIYRTPDSKTGTGLIQMFDQQSLWLDVGYAVVEGELEEGKHVKLARTSSSSPTFLENHSELDDLIQFGSFQSVEDQCQWIVDSICRNLTEDELQPSDIIVINPDPITTRSESAYIRKALLKKRINSHLAGVDRSPDSFFDADNSSVTFTGIFRAKGNEAGMVYVINAQDCYSSFGSIATARNRLFTAITRSKSWVRIVGIGESMDALTREYIAVKEAHFTLDFSYPTADVRRSINIINRDMTPEEKKAVKSSTQQIERIVSDVENGRVLLEDLPPEMIDRFKKLFKND